MTINFKHGQMVLRPMPIASGTVISMGDQVIRSAGKIRRFSGADDNLIFAGIARGSHRSTDPSGEITVAMPLPGAVFEVEIASATTITFGDELQWSAHQKVAKSTTDAIWTAVESKLSATKINAMMQLPTQSELQLTGDAS